MAPETGVAPPGYHTVTPYLMVKDVLREIEFLASAFGAEETTRNATYQRASRPEVHRCASRKISRTVTAWQA